MAELGRVYGIHPESQSIDVRLDNGRILTGVPLISLSASKNSGCIDLPDISADNTALAIIDFVSHERPICLGFLHPKGNNHGFYDNRSFHLHNSGVYHTITPDGEATLKHPSGAFAIMGELTSPDALENTDYQEKFAATKNTGKAPVFTFGFDGSPVRIKFTPTGLVVTGGDVMVSGISFLEHVHGNGNNGSDTTVPK